MAALTEHHNLGPRPAEAAYLYGVPCAGEVRKWSNRAGPHVGWHNSSFGKGVSPRPARPSEGKGLPPIPAQQPRAHNPQKIPAPNPMALPDLSDPERAAPEEPGVSVEAMEVGVQFLRDATEQYNFESQVKPEADHEDPGAPVGQLISEATLESADQVDVPLPVSDALLDEQPEVLGEPEELDVDLTSDAIRAASLFDQPLNELAADEEEEAEDELDVTLAGPLRQPAIATDDPSEVDDAKLEAIQRAFDERVKKRLHVDRLPSTREDEEDKP